MTEKMSSSREKSLSKTFNSRSLIIGEALRCHVCAETNLSVIMDLPNLPQTGRFTKNPVKYPIEGIDQKLLWCPKCGHGQLFNQVDPAALYSPVDYIFKTSSSHLSHQGTEKFIGSLAKHCPKEKFECVLDVGCNDLHLLNKLKTRGKWKVGIDPIWASQKPGNLDHNTMVIGESIEQTDLGQSLPSKPDLIVCRHTLEHIYDPYKVIKKIMNVASGEALFIFEFPNFDSLLTRGRFDQVFHEHLQYFSLNSIRYLLDKCGAELIDVACNYHNWGALIVVFRKKKKVVHELVEQKMIFSEKEISQKIRLFKTQMEITTETLLGFKGSLVYGYGAALMLPTLAYHMKEDLSFLKAILDDDKEKDGLAYMDLPVKICWSGKVSNLDEATIFLTALENVKPIMTKLLAIRPKHIIYPLNII